LEAVVKKEEEALSKLILLEDFADGVQLERARRVDWCMRIFGGGCCSTQPDTFSGLGR
jgi:hypothetical protein